MALLVAGIGALAVFLITVGLGWRQAEPAPLTVDRDSNEALQTV